ncbi:GGDEF domain-containing protein [Alteromonas sediminis]|uniref:diguanylate cyclase n=1 Tax=Alteromonas sediminis TaxID=2259342 RepID=A0A3N5YFF8_9ALTE|nr:GGDEF domain-containing protein [Alteromonas sediminis]RPJ68775.1 GGDEF domain-containing protein [Alteromonas sediminis]
MQNALKFLVFISILLYQASGFASEQARLSQSYDKRFSDRAESLRLLQTIDESRLSDSDKNKFTYLSLYHDIFAGKITSSVRDLKTLNDTVDDPELKLTILGTLLSAHVGVKDWHAGFADVDKVQAIFDDYPHLAGSEDGLRTSNGVGIFLNAAEEYERAAAIAESVIARTELPSTLCIAHNILVQALENRSEFEKFDRVHEQGIKHCNEASMSYIVLSLNYSKVMQKSQIWSKSRTIDYALQQLDIALEEGFLPLIHSFQSFLAGQYCEIEDFQECLSMAYAVIRTGSDNGYIVPRLFSYEYAAIASAELGYFENAHTYWEAFSVLQRQYYSDLAARQIAVQNARFNDQAKEAQIALLDKENSLLQTEAKLSAEQIQNSLLALALSAFLLIALLLWSWRAMIVQKKLKVMAREDSLTHIANRGYFTELARIALEKSKPIKQTVTIILFDLDHFKRINDNYGHHVGDWALKSAVRAVEGALGNSATVGRVGGEEFAIFAEGLSLEEATELAEKCRGAIETIDPEAIHRTKFSLTASFGVCDTTQVGYNYDTLYTAADLALYQSKTRGRNRVYVYTHLTDGE